MERSIFALGERSVFGEYGRVVALGELNASECRINSMVLMGEARVESSTIQRIRSMGELTISNSTVSRLKSMGESRIDNCMISELSAMGDMVFTGTCKVNRAVFTGEVDAENLECGYIRNSIKGKAVNALGGVLKWRGVIKSDVLESLHAFNITSGMEFKSIVSSNLLSSSEEICCENLYSFGQINASTINGENIFILVNPENFVDDVVGTNITISRSFSGDRTISGMGLEYLTSNHYLTDGIMTLKTIEGDNIKVDSIKAERVSGGNVTIGSYCSIDKVTYTGSINISEYARVAEVIKG